MKIIIVFLCDFFVFITTEFMKKKKQKQNYTFLRDLKEKIVFSNDDDSN